MVQSKNTIMLTDTATANDLCLVVIVISIEKAKMIIMDLMDFLGSAPNQQVVLHLQNKICRSGSLCITTVEHFTFLSATSCDLGITLCDIAITFITQLIVQFCDICKSNSCVTLQGVFSSGLVPIN